MNRLSGECIDLLCCFGPNFLEGAEPRAAIQTLLALVIFQDKGCLALAEK